MLIEEKRTRWIQTFHFNEDGPNLQGNNHRKRDFIRMTQISNPILEGVPFQIEETKMFPNRPEKIDVQFTQATDFTLDLEKFNQSCTAENQKRIELLPFINNTIRQKILTKIGERLFNYDTSKFYVTMMEHQPYLMTKRRDGHNSETYYQNSYKQALEKFYHILPLINFSFCVPQLQQL